VSISASELLKRLQGQHLRLFTTADVIALTQLSPTATTKALGRLKTSGWLYSVKRGLWASRMAPDLDPCEVLPHLSSPWPAYVSLYTALSRHGVIDEVPQSIYGVTAGRNLFRRTEVGDFRIHHLPERLFWGFQMVGRGSGSFPMAEPEKAFLDLAYLGLIPRSPLGMPYKRDKRWKLDKEKLAKYAARFKFPPLVAYLKRTDLWRRN
jgi:predicted transcriptional regulator of viral defense system